MTIKKLRPITPGQRHTVLITDETLSKAGPKRSLTSGKKRISARNNLGRITVRHRGGGHKRLYREVDFKRNRDGIVAKVHAVEYDPNRSAHLALICYADGLWSYIIAPDGVKAGDEIHTGKGSPIAPGTAMVLKDMPLGSTVHCIETKPGKGASMMRSAGTSGTLLGRDNGYAIIQCRSKEIRYVRQECRATLGTVSNKQHNLRQLGKAGRKRWMGVRPTVRGVVMNPVDHPHGGGEGRTSGGRHPVTPWGVPTKGKRTRNNKRTDQLIVRRRKK